jgi:hypothetical protein
MTPLGWRSLLVVVLSACSGSAVVENPPEPAASANPANIPVEAPDWLMRRPAHMPCTIRDIGVEGDLRQVWFHAYDQGGRLVRAHRQRVGPGLESNPPNHLDEWRVRYEYDGRGQLVRYTELSEDLSKVVKDHQLTYPAGEIRMQGLEGELHRLTLNEGGQAVGDLFSVLGEVGMSSFGFAEPNPFQGKIQFLAGELMVGQTLTTVSFGGEEPKPLATVSYDGPAGGISVISSAYSTWRFGYCDD